MSAGWVAGCVRAKAMARRELGRRCGPAAGGLPVAGRGAAGAGRAPLTTGPAGWGSRSRPRSTRWPPRCCGTCGCWRAGCRATASDLLRALACWFEIANVDELLQSAAGRPAEEEFRLGALATAWPRLRRAGSPAGLRAALAASPWHDPGGDTALDIRLGLRARWAARVAACGDPARTWAAGAAALLLAGERFAARPASCGPRCWTELSALTGAAAVSAATLDDLRTAACRPGPLGPVRGQLAGRAVAGRGRLVGAGRARRLRAAADLRRRTAGRCSGRWP